MKRGYTTADYYAMMDRINEIIPNAAVSSDFIVGFCGETEEEFQMTVDTGSPLPIQEQFHLPVQRAARDEGCRDLRR